MNMQFRDRVLLPIGIPLGAGTVILVVVLIFSRVLLKVHELELVPVAIALMAAINILGVATVVSIRPRLRSIDWAALLGVAAVPMLAGGAIAAGMIQVQVHEEEPKPQAQTLSVAAANLAFDAGQLVFRAGSPLVINFANNDTVPHNIAIYRTPQDAQVQTGSLFKGTIINAAATSPYRVPSLKPGSYYFQCDIHPTMNGAVTVQEAPSEPEEPAEVEITAKGLTFDKKELSLPSGIAAVIVLNNQDPDQHNFSVYPNAEVALTQQNAVLKGLLFGGPATRRSRLNAQPPGTYYFQCDIHPTTMNGTLTAE